MAVRSSGRWWGLALLVAVGPGLSSADGPVVERTIALLPSGPVTSGAFSLLTYNVAGLYDFISDSTPSVNHPRISPMLNAWDLVLVQEDFDYADALAESAVHPFCSQPRGDWRPIIHGDGLAQFSFFPLAAQAREAWQQCNGTFSDENDCLAEKGYSVALTEIAPGLWVDVYNLHMDAGESAGDTRTRRAQVAQLIDVLQTRSVGRAVIVAGDTNLDVSLDEDASSLAQLRQRAGLLDACESLGCGQPLIDRVFFRSGGGIDLWAVDWSIPTGFMDDGGAPLSDHDPVSVRVAWRATGAPTIAVGDAPEAEGPPGWRLALGGRDHLQEVNLKMHAASLSPLKLGGVWGSVGERALSLHVSEWQSKTRAEAARFWERRRPGQQMSELGESLAK